MDILYYEWLSLFFRWFHVIAAIAWIGASFYFVWLDNSLVTPPDWKQNKGIKGDLWAFHGGGIYEVAKYKLAPETMPKTLHWFKWEAYTTWITGSILLIVIYYLKADLYLLSPGKWIQTPTLGVPASMLFIASGVAIYEVLFRCFLQINENVENNEKREKIVTVGTIIYIAFSCYLSVKLFSDRAAFLHVGAMIASIMAANVFLGIIPAQKNFIADLNRGVVPNEQPMLKAKLRSLHNNYFTLPVIFCMISNHYAFLYGHPYNRCILISILAITAYTRHYFNLKHKGINEPQILAIAVCMLLLLTLVVSADFSKDSSSSRSHVNNTQKEPVASHSTEQNSLLAISQTHCQACHSKTPSYPGFTAAPAGLIFDTAYDLYLSRPAVITAVKSNYMPLGNVTNMSDEERSLFISTLENLQVSK